jgi:hypothetical protein
MSNPLLVGIDVHRTINAVCVVDGQGQIRRWWSDAFCRRL